MNHIFEFFHCFYAFIRLYSYYVLGCQKQIVQEKVCQTDGPMDTSDEDDDASDDDVDDDDLDDDKDDEDQEMEDEGKIL